MAVKNSSEGNVCPKTTKDFECKLTCNHFKSKKSKVFLYLYLSEKKSWKKYTNLFNQYFSAEKYSKITNKSFCHFFFRLSKNDLQNVKFLRLNFVGLFGRVITAFLFFNVFVLFFSSLKTERDLYQSRKFISIPPPKKKLDHCPHEQIMTIFLNSVIFN